ncbi:phosphate acyltransferase [Enterococcus sp. HY326]|uniref:phosphate acyltransferase n=1 Tax=Enterococcus sp. HY326 TaxID=2971265 RepID=UPI00223F6C64|nr:phosphate acyltransferase [Enterococcus sp. HY326]
MIVVSIAGGSQPEILEVVQNAQQHFAAEMKFVVFDTKENIADESLWEYHHCQSEEEVVEKAVTLVAQGQAQILFKGIIQTHTLLKEVLQKKHELKTRKVISYVALIDLPSAQQSFLLTDSAMNIAPNQETMIGIVENVEEVAQRIGISQPKIALLSSAENFNPKMPSSVLAAEVTQHFKNKQNGVVFGPISFDLALSKESVQHKHYQGPIMGDADALVVPTIDVGNSLYKSLTMYAGAKVGGTIVGTKIPIVLTSRSDSPEAKLFSLEFAVKQVQQQ